MGNKNKPLREQYNQTLVLDSSWMPRSIISSLRAFTIFYKGNAYIEEYHPVTFGLVNKDKQWFKPSIIRVDSYINMKFQKVPLSRENIFKRDEYCCVYCGNHQKNLLTLDHVIPQSKGGPNTWSNLVTACKSCNSEKSDLSLEEWGKTIPQPYRPHHLMMLKKTKHIPEEWKKYLFY